MQLTLSLLVQQAHKTAQEKGWWDRPRTAPEIHMMIVTEIAEATDETRVGNDDGERKELADAVVRIADYFGKKGWNLETTIMDILVANETRPYRHGGKLF